jgi:hypothetical protein
MKIVKNKKQLLIRLRLKAVFYILLPARSLSFSKEIKITPSDIHLNDATLSSVNKRLQLHSVSLN